MIPCHQSTRAQDYLDGLLDPAAAQVYETHAAGCPACQREIDLYRRVFEALDELPTWDPGPLLTERVLDHVVPARLRRHRRLVALGWGYAGAVALSLVGMAALGSLPLVRAALAGISGDASHRVFQALTLVVNSLTWLAVRVADVGRLLADAGQWIAPVSRAVGTLISQPAVALTLTAAGAATLVVLWWMRPRDRAKERRYVAVLGF